MRWILLDVTVALVALAVLAVLVLRLWRQVKALSAAVGAAGERIGQATSALELAQLDGSPGGGPLPHGSPGARPGPGAGAAGPLRPRSR